MTASIDAHTRRCGTGAVLLAALVAAGLAVAAQAQMYRYVDENGVTVYSQVPPPTDDAAEITPDPGPSQADRDAALQRLRQQLESDFDRRTARKSAAEKEAAEAARAEARAERCRAARANLETLTNLSGRSLNLPDGRTVNPNEAQRQRLIGEARRQIRDHCD